MKKIDIAEAVHAAMIGSKYDKQKRNIKAYRRWIGSLIRRIKKLNGQKEETIWDNMEKRKRSRKLGR